MHQDYARRHRGSVAGSACAVSARRFVVAGRLLLIRREGHGAVARRSGGNGDARHGVREPGHPLFNAKLEALNRHWRWRPKPNLTMCGPRELTHERASEAASVTSLASGAAF